MLSHQLFSVEYFQLNPKTTKFVKKKKIKENGLKGKVSVS